MVSFKVVIGLLFALLVGAIAVLGVVTYFNNLAANESFVNVRKTHEVLDKIDEISSMYKDMQLESNAFFITGDSSLLDPYHQARERILSQIARLRNITAVHDSHIDSLELLIRDLIRYTEAALVRPAKGSTDGLLVRIEENRIYRKNIREITDAIKKTENKLLQEREKANDESIAAFNEAFYQLLIVVSILLVTTFLSIRYNFNKRMRMQKDLKNANELFSKMFHESPIGAVMTRVSDGVVIDCNSSYAELMNYGREELIGQKAVDLKIIENPDQRREVLHLLKSTGVIRDLEMSLKPRNREKIWVSISMQIITVQNMQCLLSVMIDMTQHKRAEEKIKKALQDEMELNRMKSNFVTLASHEFRTPLTTILSSSFLLENLVSGDNKEKVLKHLARIKSSVKNLTFILDEFLSLTKIEEGKVEPKLETFNMPEYVDTLCQNLKTFTKPGQKIVYDHNGDAQVVTDPVLLGNIINNLVSNAIKYSPDNTNIEISTKVNGRIELLVKDCGIGISPEDQKRLFERFYRASNAGTVQGTGLGLHIMKHYVSLLNGSIEVDSEIGKGTRFRITFQPPATEEDSKLNAS